MDTDSNSTAPDNCVRHVCETQFSMCSVCAVNFDKAMLTISGIRRI